MTEEIRVRDSASSTISFPPIDQSREPWRDGEARRNELQGLINQRDDAVKTLQTAITRAKSGFRATFGPDSTQYDQAGGTRKSERKAPARKARTTIKA